MIALPPFNAIGFGVPADSEGVRARSRASSDRALATLGALPEAIAQTLPMMAERRMVMVRDLAPLPADEAPALLAYFAKPNPSTVLVAREAASIDLLTDGRLQLGLGAGSLRSEYDQAGLGFDRGGTRVERLTERRVARDAGALQHLEKLALDQLDAPHDALGAAGRASRPERPVQVVEHRDEIAEQRLVGVADGLVPLPLRPPLEILRVREGPQQPILLLLDLLLQLLDRLRRTLRRRIGLERLTVTNVRLVHNV